MGKARPVTSKNKKTKTSPFLRSFSLIIFLGVIVFATGRMSFQFLKKSNVFTVKHIMFHPSLKIIETHETFSLKGRNLLDLDLKPLQRQLQARYPQFSQLRILKKFPDQLIVTAKERRPFAAAKMEGKRFILDQDGIILSVNAPADDSLPAVSGANLSKEKTAVGFPLEGRDLNLALKILKFFKDDSAFLTSPVSKIDVENLSQINIHLQDGLKIIIDEEDYRNKLKVLRLLMIQARQQLKDVKYIDVRFKEPILGKNK